MAINWNDNGTDSEAVESSKVMSETAKIKLDVSTVLEKIGPPLSRIIGEPLEQISGILTDKLRYVRWERSIRLVDRATKFMAERESKPKLRSIPLNVAIPILEAASLEENDDLQDIWARLLINAADVNSGVQVKRGFVSILQDFSPLEARLLQAIYIAPPMKGGIPTKGLPDKYIQPGEDDEDSGLPPRSVQIGLWQLMRLGCICESGTWDSISGIRRIQITALGKALVEACLTPPKKD